MPDFLSLALLWLFSKFSGAPVPAGGFPLPPATRPRPRPRPRPLPPATPTRPRPRPRPKPPAAPAAPTPRPPAAPAVATPAPWPQVVPAGLPPFPGPGWVPDSPPGAGVVARAHQLLSQLWRHGAGTFKTEKTGGRWITYVARQMGAKRGVVAYREAARPPVIAPPPVRTVPVVTPVNRPPAAPASRPAPSPVSLPTLRRGSRGPDVVTLQTRLGGLVADGIFGPATERAVRSYQSSHGLVADGIVGPKTWASLFGARS